MALSKKKSRPITVDGIEYRWIFFENSGWNDLTIQSASGKGDKLTVQIKWEPDPGDTLPYKTITPSFVEQAIKFGKVNGWSEDTQRKPFHCRYSDGSFSN